MRIYSEQVSGAIDERVQLAECLRSLSAGDTLVVFSLSRLGRSMPHLIATVNDLADRGIGFVSLSVDRHDDARGATGVPHLRVDR